MTDTISNYLLTEILNFGAPLLGLVLLLGALGIPVPGSLMVIAAGAFARQGFLSWADASFYGLVGAVIGDALSFGMGYFAKDWTQGHFGHLPAWANARNSFDQRAGIAVYLTRFLVTALALPINLIAGGSGYKFSKFIAFDVAGEITWIFGYGGLGYLFGTNWEVVSQFISDSGGFILGIVVLGAGIWMAFRLRQSGQ